ncbi:hypothetical protein GGS23DRAFT_617021 [Durotheca rogersii]|uniref:uncharacterized protein n=1 Tax=Durotheca rogersii TaxID=419775 RepID=UPI00221E5DAA|nr:uncharacterized protein GGS23DRAFT_617021 [Durotheca rogersii]KAI5865901.1 hypothetical protein GGS23DRAFT_617021 [Durotheca rogersii]
MEHSRPILPSQRYSPVSDYAYDTDHEGLPLTRRPLGESTGNVQPHSLAALALCSHSISPPIHSIPTPPIVPTQVLTSTYGTSYRGGRSFQRDASLRESPMGYSRGSSNPIYAYKHFADYRNKVMQKELEKEQPIWPLWLEDAFLDALLLIPQMGRKKFSSKTILYGRNMLITEYLWIYHWLLHPPKHGEVIPNRQQREKGPGGKPHPMYRGRKQVSSHIQVLKGFFATLVTFHFIFPSKRDAKEDDKKLMRDDDDTESFKNNRVLISIADGRLPNERPNYEYFARLLGADNDVFLRPKQCWIFVSSSQVNIKEKHIKADDGTTKKQITGYTPNGQWLGEADYPHLKLNEGKDYKDLPRNGDRPTVLLHEYTRALSQKESSSAKEITNRWDVQFPDLKEKLLTALNDTQPSDERTSRCVVGPCDTFHFEVTLDLHSTSKFPDGSELNGMVELSISRPELHNHTWRSVTSVMKPDELHISGSEPDFWDRTNPVEVIVSHRVGCNGVGRCDCAGRGSRDTIGVPFPAASWANTFIKLAPYVTAEQERRERKGADSARGSRPTHADREAARIKKEDDESSRKPGGNGKIPTPKELLSKVAMYQEIWSAPNDETGKSGWVRRAVILWTFVPVHEHTDEKGKTVMVAPGTNWRFLTKVDPTSEYHQQRAYLSGSPSVSRDSVMSPNPGYQHHVNAAMHENLSAAFDAPPPIAPAPILPGNHHQQSRQPPPDPQHRLSTLDMLDSFDNGLVTPPPTASLHGSYPPHFHDPNTAINNGGTEHSLHHQLSFISDGTSGPEIAPERDSNADPFLSGLGVAGSQCDPNLQNWTATSQNSSAAGLGLDPSTGWGPGYGVTWADTTALTSATTSAGAGEPLWATAPGMPASARDSISTSSSSHWAGGDDRDAGLHPHSHYPPPAPLHPDQHGDGAWPVWPTADPSAIAPGPWALSDAHHYPLNLGDTPPDLAPSRSSALPHAHPQRPHQHPHPHPHPLPPAAGRKRGRAESADDDDDERARYPAYSVRKLSHQHSSARTPAQRPGAPAAVMDDGRGYL